VKDQRETISKTNLLKWSTFEAILWHEFLFVISLRNC